MLSAAFAKAALERCLKSFCQVLVALWGAGQFDVLHVDWSHSFGIAAGAAVLSVLTSVVSSPFGPSGSPSLVESHAD